MDPNGFTDYVAKQLFRLFMAALLLGTVIGVGVTLAVKWYLGE